MEGVTHGGKLAHQMMDVAIRVESIRPFAVEQMSLLIANSSVLLRLRFFGDLWHDLFHSRIQISYSQKLLKKSIEKCQYKVIYLYGATIHI